jgi:hypothetical protein
MKAQKRLILTIVTVLGVLLAFAAPIAAQASITEITGTEVPYVNPIIRHGLSPMAMFTSEEWSFCAVMSHQIRVRRVTSKW